MVLPLSQLLSLLAFHVLEFIKYHSFLLAVFRTCIFTEDRGELYARSCLRRIPKEHSFSALLAH